MQKVISWWERVLVASLILSVALLGIGRLQLFPTSVRISAWSVSRTAFFFWVLLKLLLFARDGWAGTGLSKLRGLAPLFGLLLSATVSLLPDFSEAGDYRYFFFGCFHAVMLVDLFSGRAQARWLPLLSGLLPIVFVVRGLVHDPEILRLALEHRLSFPLDHANTAGYLLAMSIPLALVAGIGRPGWRGCAALASCAGQVFALILTFSRGAWLGWSAAMLYCLAMTKSWKWVAGLIVIAATAVAFSPSLSRRLSTFFQPGADQAMSDRLEVMIGALQAGLENPILGVGYGRGRLKEAVRPHLSDTSIESSPVWHSHNVYVELFAVTGLLGLSAFLWLVGDVFYRIARARTAEGADRLLGHGLAASWMAAAVAAIGDVPFYHHETRMFFFSLVAFAHLYGCGTDPSKDRRSEKESRRRLRDPD